MLKKVISMIGVFVLTLCFVFDAFSLENGDLSAASAVLYCPDTGEILFEKNPYEQHSMASTTKIMTALIALEQNTPKREVRITAEMVNVEGTSSGLRAGDIIYLEDIVYCMLLESGNDAANSAAIAIGGSFEGFAVMMNERAKEIGMENTSFVTPSGLDDDEHYTTAYDMALLAAEALKNEDFVRICSAPSYKTEFIDSDKVVTLYNHNRLLSEYEGCFGMKTGFTKKSGRCLVSAARRNGVTLIAVTLSAPDDWNDHKKMLDSGFSQMGVSDVNTDFSSYGIRVVGSDEKKVGVECSDFSLPFSLESGAPDVTCKVYLEKFLYAPVKKGDVVGFAEYYIDKTKVKTVSLTASSDISAAEFREPTLKDKILDFFGENNG